MKARWTLVTVLILAIVVLCFINSPIVEPDNKTNAAKQTPKTQDDTRIKSSTQTNLTQPQTDERLRRLSNGYVEYKPALETSHAISTAETPELALALIQQVLNHYRYAYQENPVGVENFEITEQLLGLNPKKIIFVAAGNPALRENELIDQWSTPYFFHALSSQNMEIRSAGPDQKFWTDDDITLAENNP